MKKYYNNPEIKISSFVLILLITSFLILTIVTLKLHDDDLKEQYTGSIGAIALRAVEKSPDIEKEIIPIVTREISNEESEKGKAFLKQYGISKNLEISLFPHINDLSTKNKNSIITIFSIMAILLILLNYIELGYFYKRIRRLTLAANKVVEGEYDILISEEMEGDFSKLACSFNSMRDIIRNNISELKTEKIFLVNLLSDISHQLKTPLSSMIVYNDIMLDENLTKEQEKTFLLSNKKQLLKMNWLIKNLLKLAKLDSHAIELNKEEQSINETIHESIDAIYSKAYDENISINFHEKHEIIFKHDRQWIEEAFNNIIKNAVEHTNSGGEINIKLSENPIYYRVIIEDTGEGIREEDLPNIFKRFYKAKSSKNNDSIGIGLAISKSIIELHNGVIDVESKLGVGTKFTITFLKY